MTGRLLNLVLTGSHLLVRLTSSCPIVKPLIASILTSAIQHQKPVACILRRLVIATHGFFFHQAPVSKKFLPHTGVCVPSSTSTKKVPALDSRADTCPTSLYVYMSFCGRRAFSSPNPVSVCIQKKRQSSTHMRNCH